MAKIGGFVVSVLIAATVALAPSAAATTMVRTRTVLGAVLREGCQVSLTTWGDHWSTRANGWVQSEGQYVQLQVLRNGRWRELGAVLLAPSNNAKWAIMTFIHRSCARHTYRAVTPPAWSSTTTYRLGSHSVSRTG